MRSRDNGVNEWDAIFDKNIDECMAESTNMPAAPPAVDPADNCNPKFGFVSMCIMKKNFAVSPNSGSIYRFSIHITFLFRTALPRSTSRAPNAMSWGNIRRSAQSNQQGNKQRTSLWDAVKYRKSPTNDLCS